MKRIGIIYKDNFPGALALFMKLEKQQEGELLTHSISCNCDAHYKDSKIEVREYGSFHHIYDELYLDKYLDEREISLCKKYIAADEGCEPKVSMF